jgi:alpha-glucosidase
MLGKILNCELNKNVFAITFEEGSLKAEFTSKNIFRLYQTRNRSSYSVIRNLEPRLNCTFEMIKGKKAILTNDFFKVEIENNAHINVYNQKGILVLEGKDDVIDLNMQNNVDEHEDLKFLSTFKVHENEYFYGLGDKPGPLNKSAYEFINWNTDIPQAHVETMKSLYKSVPFFIGNFDDAFYGVFLDNTYRTVFNFANKDINSFYFGATGGLIDCYFMVGDNAKEIVRSFAYLTGTFPLPQMWTLGNQQSRWSYGTEKEAQGIVDMYNHLKIPLDVLHLDIDYMEGYRVFTTSEEKFPKMKEWISSLNKQGVKIVTIIDPGVKVDPRYFVYKEGLKNGYFATLGKDVYHNEVWPGDSVFPAFSNSQVRKWWGNNTKLLVDLGVSGIWNDMNEPASFKGPLPYEVAFKSDDKPLFHDEMHNVFGHLMAEATYEGLKETGKRPFIITRSCFAGTNRYSTVWTGDNQSLWDHIRLAIPQQISLGLSGITFMGTDIGGFGGDATPELMSRWIEVGCFSPLMRNHSAFSSKHQEPWMFDEQTLNIYRKYVNLRYKIIPYMYDLFVEEEKNGDPIIRSIFYNFPHIKGFENTNDEFMLGESILVSPVVTSGASAKLVQLPDGIWFDYWNDETLNGGYVIKLSPIDVCPIYIKSGAIIPTFVDGLMRVSKQDEIIFNVYQGKGEYIHYQDDGESFAYRNGIINEYKIVVNELGVSVELIKFGYLPIYKKITIIYHCSGGKTEKTFTGIALNKKFFVKI